MARLAPKITAIRSLFARSGNHCSFPDCEHEMINSKNQFIGQICHIEAALPGGERYNPDQTDEDRRAYENLILFCYRHHIETNDVSEYSVGHLKKIKKRHETSAIKLNYKIEETALHKIVSEMISFWNQIDRLNKLEHSMPELSYEIDTKSSFVEIIEACRENISIIAEFHEAFHESDQKLHNDFEIYLKSKDIDPNIFIDISYSDNPFFNRNWEMHNLGIPNRMGQIWIDLMQIEIMYLEEYLKTNDKDLVARNRMDKLKKEFTEVAQHASGVD